jgi:hypothetical protein
VKNPIYTYRGKRYEILSEQTNRHGDTLRAEQLIRDFLYCESIGDWDTITNRISNGMKWGWIREIQNKEGEDEKGFW